jgi:hypothetical protein
MATEAQLRKRRENKARRRNPQRLQKLANNRLSHQEEQQAIYMSKHLHRCLILLRGSIKEFLTSWGLAPREDEDTSTMLKTLIQYNKRIPTFISLTSNRIDTHKNSSDGCLCAQQNLPRQFTGYLEGVSILLARLD